MARLVEAVLVGYVVCSAFGFVFVTPRQQVERTRAARSPRRRP